MHPIFKIILNKQEERRNPKFPVSYVTEILFGKLDIGDGEGGFVLRPHRRGHSSVNVDQRIVGQRIIRNEQAAWLKGPRDLLEQ